MKATTHYSLAEKKDMLDNCRVLKYKECAQLANMLDTLTFKQIKELKQVISEISRGKLQ